MPRIFAVVFLGLIGLVLINGCTTPNTKTVDSVGFEAYSAEKGLADVSVLNAGDIVQVSVEVDGEMEYSSHNSVVSQMGFVTLPLIGDVHVGGVGLNVARASIARRYGEYYVNKPVVMISLVGADGVSEWGQVTVMGRVRNPGPVELSSAGGMRLSAVIQAAGGFAPSAKSSDIQITRIDSAGNKIRTEIDFNEIGKSGKAEEDLLLKEGDIVFVPQRVF